VNNWLLDTSVYISLFREGKSPWSALEDPTRNIYLSSVVAQELYAGALDAFSIRALDRLVRSFQDMDRVLTPDRGDWIVCGKTLALIGKAHGFETVKRSRLVNDVLIALSAQRANATLVTANQKDFDLIEEFIAFSHVPPA